MFIIAIYFIVITKKVRKYSVNNQFSTVQVEIIYDKVVSFNLDLMGDSGNCNEAQVEKFFLSVFKLIRRDEDRSSLTLISKIRDLYYDYAPSNVFDDTSNVLIRLDNRLLEYMKWKLRIPAIAVHQFR